MVHIGYMSNAQHLATIEGEYATYNIVKLPYQGRRVPRYQLAVTYRDGVTKRWDARYSERLAREQATAIEARLEAKADAARAQAEAEYRNP